MSIEHKSLAEPAGRADETQRPTTAPRLGESVDEAARRMGISRALTYVLIGDGKIDAVKCGRKTLVVSDSIERYFASLPRANIRPARRAA